MHINDDYIVNELLEYESGAPLSFLVFVELNTMDFERRKKIYNTLDVARMLSKDPEDNPRL